MSRSLARHIVHLAILALVASASLFADSGPPQMEQRLQSTGWSDSEKKQVLETLTQAGQQQIPMESLELRLDEGLAKHVAPQAIQTALKREIEAYTLTRTIVTRVLQPTQAQQVLADSSVWSRIATMYQQGVNETELTRLLNAFNQQTSAEKWSNLKYGAGLLLALRQWGLPNEQSQAVVEALSRSPIPGADYRLVMDLFNAALLKRVTPTEMAERIIQSAPKSRSISVLERQVR